jgi:hypothetical protein
MTRTDLLVAVRPTHSIHTPNMHQPFNSTLTCVQARGLLRNVLVNAPCRGVLSAGDATLAVPERRGLLPVEDETGLPALPLPRHRHVVPCSIDPGHSPRITVACFSIPPTKRTTKTPHTHVFISHMVVIVYGYSMGSHVSVRV